MTRLIVTGTDTGVGKTVVAAAIAGALNAHYWKPIQSGVDPEGTDRDRVADLSDLPPGKILPEAYRLKLPASPHLAAEHEGLRISLAKLALPNVDGALVVEGAGGLMVPVTREWLLIDQFRSWRLPVVLVARTTLGTINHTLLSIEALNGRNIPILGVVFVGEANEDSEHTIRDMGNVKRLGRLPRLASLTRETLSRAFKENFNIEDFH